MLCVKRLQFVDNAEEKAQWMTRVQEQWGCRKGDLVAVRVRRGNGNIIGTTFPEEFALKNDTRGEWYGVDWMAESAATPQTEPPAAAATVAPAQVSPALGAAGVDEELPAPDSPTNAEAAEVENQGAEGAEEVAPQSQSASSADASPSAAPSEEGSSATLALLDVSDVENGLILVEVVAGRGVVVATLALSIHSALQKVGSGGNGTASTEEEERYAVQLTPSVIKVADDNVVHGVLELLVIPKTCVASRDGQATCPAIHDVRAVPTPLAAGVLRFSSFHFFFPTCFVSGSGAYVVSNVVCVESASTGTVTIQLVVTGDSELIRLMPSNIVTLRKAGERAYFVCTWNLFRPFTTSSGPESTTAVKVHALITENGENKPSVDIHIHGEPPRPGEQNHSFLYWVNTVRVGNVTISAEESAMLHDMLPIYSLGRESS